MTDSVSVRTAFQSDRQIQASGFSTISLPGILSNVSNKFTLEGFEGVDNTWRSFAGRRATKDFKEITSYRLLDGGMFEQLPSTGEIKHGDLIDTCDSPDHLGVGRFGLDQRAEIVRSERVLDPNRNSLRHHRLDRWRIDHLRAEV